jgi:hypothetical protein
MTEYRAMTLEDITQDVEELIAEVVESWFVDEPLNREDFADRLENVLPDKMCLPNQFDDPVMLRVLKLARKVKREMD